MYIKKPHRGIEPQCGSLAILVADIARIAGIFASAAALGVFGWLEVMNFDRFFGFLLFLHCVFDTTFQLFVVSVVSVSVAPNSN
jgi:hypothetical protein